MNATLEAGPIHIFDRSELRRWSVAEYQKFIDLGILTGGDKVELLEGEVVNRMPASPQHDYSVMIMNELLFTLLNQEFFIRSQLDSELHNSRPEPDLAVVRRMPKAFFSRRPGPEDLLFIIEIADSSLDRDRIDKARIYARAGIPVYWVVNLIEGQIEVYTDPTGPAEIPEYRNRKDYPRGRVIPVEFDDKNFGSIASEEVLPEAVAATT